MSDALRNAGNVIYVVDLEADAAIEGPFDTWLRDHIADLLQFRGFLSAEVLSDASATPGKVRRTVQYRLRDQAALDDYLREQAPRMRAQGVALFGDRFTAQRRILAHREEFIRGAVSTENCLNCGEVLTGQHCAHCGQRAKVRVLSLWGLLKDVLGDALDWDSRLWRTLRPLAFNPGKLTQEYLQGRRARYTPPFRMYLILSVAFFLVASLGKDIGGDFRFNVDEKGEPNLQLSNGDERAADAAAAQRPASATPAPAAKTGAKLDAGMLRLIEQIVSRMPEKDRAQARLELQTRLAQVPAQELAPVRKILEDPCSENHLRVDFGPLGQEYGPRVRQACRKILTDTPSFGRALYQNLPKMMFIFLPLIAGVVYLLYLGSGRYYVEHLLFVVHYHAFFFLGGLAILLLERTATAASGTAVGKGASAVGDFVAGGFAIYAPIYLYLAMRRVYGQGRIVTATKFSTLGIAYLFCVTITAVGLLFYTALTL